MGDWFNTIALYTIILQLTGSGRDVGLLLVARFVPSFLFGPVAGVVADRFSRQRIMIVSDLLRAVVVLGFLFVRRADQLWIVYVLTVLQLGLSTFFEPAKTAAIPSIVEDRELVAANAISSVTWSAMLTIGAALGGIMTSAFGTDVSFVLDAATYLLSAALIGSIRVPKRKKRERQKLSLGRILGITETIEGIRYVKDRPRVLALLLVKPAWGLGGGILTLLAVFGERIFPVGKNAAGANEAYRPVPSFWSEQYDLYLQGVGWPPATPGKYLHRPLPGNASIVFQVEGTQLIYALAINAQRDIASARRLIERKIAVNEADLIDPAKPLADMLKAKA